MKRRRSYRSKENSRRREKRGEADHPEGGAKQQEKDQFGEPPHHEKQPEEADKYGQQNDKEATGYDQTTRAAGGGAEEKPRQTPKRK